MISQEQWKILTLLQKLPKNVDDLGIIIVATGFEKLLTVQQIAQSGHTEQIIEKNIKRILTPAASYLLMRTG